MTETKTAQENKNSGIMNEDLESWVNETPKKISDDSSENKKIKKPKGKCKICGDHAATSICVKCGTPVCNSHFYHIIGVCEKCLSKETVEKWKKHNPNWKKLLGVDWLD